MKSLQATKQAWIVDWQHPRCQEIVLAVKSRLQRNIKLDHIQRFHEKFVYWHQGNIPHTPVQIIGTSTNNFVVIGQTRLLSMYNLNQPCAVLYNPELDLPVETMVLIKDTQKFNCDMPRPTLEEFVNIDEYLARVKASQTSL